MLKTPIKYSKEKEADLLSEYYRSGDLELLGKIYQPYMHLVYGLCLKYLKDQAKSEDAVMQIFELLIEKLRVHRVDNFKSWLYSVSRNHCLMQLRASGKDIVVMDDSFMESAQIPHQDIDKEIQEEKLQLLEKCIGELNPEQQQSVRLFYLEEKCYKDIAEMTGFDIKKVKSYIQNGRRNLKICMEKNHG
jgi:RNA polymerase sigma-70 factor (ECF subfamily)